MLEGARGVLLVEDDLAVADTIVCHVERTLRARVTHVRSASEAVRCAQEHPHEVVIADLLLPDTDGLDLIRQLRASIDPAVVALTDNPTVGTTIEAMHLGVIDLFTKPVDVQRLTAVLEHTLERRDRQRREQLRRRRLRQLTSRIVRERRSLRQRMDLVCRDLVHAYRRLAEQFVDKFADR